jgi:hypothetical protein
MLHDAGTRQQSLSNLPDDWRKHTLMQLRALILRQGPDLEESVDYKMLGYGGQDRFVFHLNAQKGYVSLYVRDIRKTRSSRRTRFAGQRTPGPMSFDTNVRLGHEAALSQSARNDVLFMRNVATRLECTLITT